MEIIARGKNLSALILQARSDPFSFETGI